MHTIYTSVFFIWHCSTGSEAPSPEAASSVVVLMGLMVGLVVIGLVMVMMVVRMVMVMVTLAVAAPVVTAYMLE